MTIESAKLKRRINDLRANIEAVARQYGRKLDGAPENVLADVEAWGDELDELLEAHKSASAKEAKATADRNEMNAIFRGEGGAAPIGDGSQSGRAASTGLSAAIFGAGWNLHERPKVTLENIPLNMMASTLPSAETYRPRQATTILRAGADERWLYPWLRTQNVGFDTSVSDFTQTGSRTITGTVERALDASSDKAELDVTISAATVEIKQVAVVIEDIPNSLLASMPMAEAFFEQELSYQLQKAIDAHVIAQIEAATPPEGLTGADLFTQVRNAVGSMRLLGENPDLLVLDPADAAALDLLQDSEGRYYFGGPSRSAAEPVLWGLRVVENVSSIDNEPMLIDSERIGVLYLGSMALEADPYSQFKKNLTNLRAEMSVLMHVRDANAAHIVVAEG